MQNKTDAISFDFAPRDTRQSAVTPNERVKLTKEDLGRKQQDSFVAWNCPFDECKVPNH